MPLLLLVRSERIVMRVVHVVLQPPSPDHFDADPHQQDEEEEEEPEQQTAYQRLLSTLSQPTSKELSEESSESEEEEEELLEEGGLFYLKHNKGSIKHFVVNQCSLLLFVLVVSDGDGEPGEDQRSDEEKGGEEDAEEPLSTMVQEGKKENGVEEFIDEEHESQFCLETNFIDEEEEETDRTLEHHDSTGKIHAYRGMILYT